MDSIFFPINLLSFAHFKLSTSVLRSFLDLLLSMMGRVKSSKNQSVDATRYIEIDIQE